MNTSVTIGSLKLKNPVTVASGTAGYGEELSDFIKLSDIGAVFTKGLTLAPREGNSGNRIIETPSGVLNSIGLQNVGLEKFIQEKLPFLLKNSVTVIPNIAGHSVDENVELCRTLSREDGIDAIELNVSCPNVQKGGMAFGTSMELFTELLEDVRKVTDCALIVKLSPNVTDIAEFAIKAEKIGADGISAVNTLLGMKIDTKKRAPHFINRVAGLSGPAILPIAVRAVYQIYEKVTIPIIGMGGISSLNDMLEFLMAGASAISIGTMGMIDPELSVKLIDEFTDYMRNEKIEKLEELVGAAHND